MGQAHEQQGQVQQQDGLEQPGYRLEVEAADASHGHVPLWCWPLLAAAVSGMHSNAVRQLPLVPATGGSRHAAAHQQQPLMFACWWLAGVCGQQRSSSVFHDG
jgi:hypothetical protein